MIVIRSLEGFFNCKKGSMPTIQKKVMEIIKR